MYGFSFKRSEVLNMVFLKVQAQGCDIMLMVKKFVTFQRIMSSSSGSSSSLF